jgi:diacylglycerol kinase family enzyme
MPAKHGMLLVTILPYNELLFMKTALLLHNPSSGKTPLTKEQLVALVNSKGFDCVYASIKDKGWDEINKPVDFIIVAGGDGTIRKVARKLLRKKDPHKQLPIGLLPMGTANNIATTFEQLNDPATLLESFHHSKLRPFDVGKAICTEDNMFFLEAFGFGIFPNLMNNMHDEQKKFERIEEEINYARKMALKTIDAYKPRECSIKIDGADHSGEFLLVEVMNTPLIGPNLGINPLGNTSDGTFEIILVSEAEKEKLKEYIEGKIAERTSLPTFSTLKGKNIEIKWKGARAHVDDELIKPGKWQPVSIELHNELFQFLVPNV